jgi:hypothetical protein
MAAGQHRGYGVSRLEERYRFVLRALPASYREMWQEEMVATFLEGAQPDDPEDADYVAEFGRPSWPEVASVLALAVRLRIGTAGAPPRYAAWGQAIRLVALVGLLSHAVLGTATVAIRLWLAGKLSWLPAPRTDWMSGMPADVWHAAWDLSGLLWVPPFLALLFGQWRVARALATLALLPGVVATVVVTVDGVVGNRPPLSVSRWLTLVLDVLFVLALAAFHRDAPAVRPRPWLIAFVVAAPVVPVSILLSASIEGALPLLDSPALGTLALLGGAAAHLAGPLFGRPRRLAWSHALALLAGAVLLLRVATLWDYTVSAPADQRGLPMILGIVEAVALVAVGGLLALHTARALRQLPATRAGSAVWSGL